MMNALQSFSKLFGRSNGVILGMVHVQALPGTPRHCMPMPSIIKKACQEAAGYQSAGVDGIMLENMHDIPYLHSHAMGPEVTAAMTAIASQVRRICPTIPCGMQVLTAQKEALAVAMATGLDFIRAEGFVFSHIGDEGLINSCAGELLRYQRNIGAENIKIFTDIKKKHSSHAITADVSIEETAEAAEFFGSDGVIVTGTATGQPAKVEDLQDVQGAVNIPVLIGSGVNTDNVDRYLGASALIVGSHFKHGGQWLNDVDFGKVDDFMTKVNTFRQSGNSVSR
ncbi:uncharacterized protein F13E9.13, mitochondrial-like [Amphiura filiformis]|uniref:uncharacterized protein F13E9.13, mitochondrial-like n=1 Tax=Amphiura filiformis TaxID=82378 RepID=UPI003B21EFED